MNLDEDASWPGRSLDMSRNPGRISIPIFRSTSTSRFHSVSGVPPACGPACFRPAPSPSPLLRGCGSRTVPNGRDCRTTTPQSHKLDCREDRWSQNPAGPPRQRCPPGLPGHPRLRRLLQASPALLAMGRREMEKSTFQPLTPLYPSFSLSSLYRCFFRRGAGSAQHPTPNRAFF